MSIAILNFLSTLTAALLAVAVIIRGRRSTANWLFFVGMVALALNSLFDGLSLQSTNLQTALFWQGAALMAKSFLPGVWLCFSLVYSRGNYREFLARWRWLIAAGFILPTILMAAFQDDLLRAINVNDAGVPVWIQLGSAGKGLSAVILVTVVLILMNLEKTFRTAIGTMRWRIKFVVLGLCVIFGAKIFTASQALLYSGVNLSFSLIESSALLIGCILIGLSYLRSGRVEIEVYPSQAFLYSSIAVVVAGIYLSVVGLLAHLVAILGGDTDFPIKAFFMLLGIVGLAIMLLSERIRQSTKRFVSRHFHRPLYDYRNVWRSFTEGTLSRVEQTDLCQAVVTFVSHLFQALSVTIWLVDEENGRLTFGASTSLRAAEGAALISGADLSAQLIRVFRMHPDPVDIDASTEPWCATLRNCTPGEFRKGGHRICVPISAGGELLGLIMLGDRVNGIPMSVQDTDLVKCISDQAAACLRNIKLSHRLMQAKEMEAFQTMSAFFVHDLKNTASTLSLMLQNLPVHFNDPEFREDALRGIAHSVKHINGMIGRLSLLRQELKITPIEADLNELVAKTLSEQQGSAEVRLISDLRPVPRLLIDQEQLEKVVTNLILNAREASPKGGEIRVHTSHEQAWAILTVSDDGCGMSPDFLARSLFRPFQTTKKKGIGIGMFQSKMIVEAHRGKIEVQSGVGTGTTFRVSLPCTAPSHEA